MKIDINEIKNKVNKFVGSKNFAHTIYFLGALFILLFVFQAGMIVGFKRASFEHNWGDNYERNFGPRHKAPPIMGDMIDVTNSHGAIGRIIRVELPNIVVLDKDQTEKVVIINDSTNIFERKDKITKNSLTVDKFIIVIGSPNDSGQIEAKLIRIMPSPEEMMRQDFSRFDDRLPLDNIDRKI